MRRVTVESTEFRSWKITRLPISPAPQTIANATVEGVVNCFQRRDGASTDVRNTKLIRSMTRATIVVLIALGASTPWRIAR